MFSECEYFFKVNLYQLMYKVTHIHVMPVDMTSAIEANFQQW